MSRDLREIFEAARKGKLPPDFDRWDLADKDGWTVAHITAQKHQLPLGFNRWRLVDIAGRSVAQVAEDKNKLPRSNWHETGLLDYIENNIEKFETKTVINAAEQLAENWSSLPASKWEKTRLLEYIEKNRERFQPETLIKAAEIRAEFTAKELLAAISSAPEQQFDEKGRLHCTTGPAKYDEAGNPEYHVRGTHIYMPEGCDVLERLKEVDIALAKNDERIAARATVSRGRRI